jgi:GAF domain-containing protein
MEVEPIGTRQKWLVRWLTKWFVIPLVLVITLLLPSLRTHLGWVCAWLALYTTYLVVLEILSRTKKSYETQWFRLVRIRLMAVLGSILIALTGGTSSPFWFIYLWSLFAGASYLSWSAIWRVYGEVAALYCLASLVAARGLTGIDAVVLLINLGLMAGLTFILGQSSKRYQAAENELKFSKILEETQQDVDAAIHSQDVLDRILRRAVESIGAKGGILMLLDEHGELRVRARHAESLPNDEIDRAFKPGEGVAGWVLQNRRPYICYDTRTDPYFAPIVAPSSSIRSLVSAPIIAHGMVLGVINADHAEAGHFSGADAKLLLTLASQVAVAIERSVLLDSLKEIGEKSLSGNEDPCEYVVRAVHQLTHCPVAMWQVDEEIDTQARIRACAGLRPEYAGERILDLEHSVTGRAILTSELVEVYDIETDPDLSPETRDEARLQGWKSILVVPLLPGSRRTGGTLSIYSSVQKRFTSWEINLLRMFADQAAIVLKARARQESLERLVKIGETLTWEVAAGLKPVLVKVAKSACDLTGANCAVIYPYEPDRQLSYDLENVVAYGLHKPRVLKEKPRERGLAAIVRVLDELVVHDVDKGELGEIDFGRLPDVDQARLVEFIQEEKFVQEEGVKSFVGMSLKVGVSGTGARQREAGILYIDFCRPHRFVEEELALIRVFGHQVASTIQGARLLQRRIDDLGIVNEVGQIINTKLKTEALFCSIVSQVAEKLDCSHCTLFLAQVEEGRITLVPHVTHGEFSEQIMRRRFAPGEGLAGWVYQWGESLILADARKDPRFSPPIGVDQGPRSILVAPVKIGDQTIGVISADQDGLGWFSESDLRLVEALARQAGTAIQRARALDLLHDVSNRIIAVQKMDDVLQQILLGATELVNATSGGIYLLSEDEESIVKAFQSPSGLYQPMPRMTKEDGLTRQVIASGDVLVVRETCVDRRVNPTVLDSVTSVISVPLKLGQKLIGVLHLNDRDPHDFTEMEVSLLQILASQAAIAIQKARLAELLELERRERIDAIREMGFGITAGIGLEEVLRGLLTTTIHLMREASAGEIWLLEEQSGKLKVWASQGETVAEISELRVGDGIVGQVAASGKPHLSANVEEDVHFVRRLVGTKSEVAVPMLLGHQVIGVLNVEHPQSNAFSEEEDIPLLEAIASQVVIAMENARLYDQLSRQVKEKDQLLQALRDEQRKNTAAVSLAAVSAVATDLVHRMNNVAGTTPVRVAQIEELLDPVVPNYERIAYFLTAIGKDVDGMLAAAGAIRSANVTTKPELVDVGTLIGSAIKRVSGTPGKSVHSRCNDGLPKVLALSGPLVETLESMMRNGLESITGSGTVEVVGRKVLAGSQDWVAIDVADTGSGISPEHLPKIFDLGFTTKANGMGFALWKAKALTESLGGRIDVQTVLGRGTTFTIFLPAARKVVSE